MRDEQRKFWLLKTCHWTRYLRYNRNTQPKYGFHLNPRLKDLRPKTRLWHITEPAQEDTDKEKEMISTNVRLCKTSETPCITEFKKFQKEKYLSGDAWKCPNRHLCRISRKTTVAHWKTHYDPMEEEEIILARISMNEKCQRPRHTCGDAREYQSRPLLTISKSPGPETRLWYIASNPRLQRKREKSRGRQSPNQAPSNFRDVHAWKTCERGSKL